MRPHLPFVRSKPLLAFVVLVMVGCLVGIFSVSRSSPSAVRGLATLEYSGGWRPVRHAPALPGLRVLDPVALTPGGRASNAGLVLGVLAGSRESPLPETLIAVLHSAPRAEVVEALGGQDFYRYRFNDGEAVELYVQPSPGENANVLACYAPLQAAARLHECSQIVASATPQSGPEGLTPDREFASSLATVLATFEDGRRQQSPRLEGAPSAAAAAAEAATALSGLALSTERSVSGLDWPSVLGGARSSLEGGLRSASAAYSALARAAGAREAEAFDTARLRVAGAEQEIDRALADFAIYGYS